MTNHVTTYKTEDFNYHLPPEYIAQQPAEPRDSSRLLVLHRATGQVEHRIFRDIGDYLQPDDLLVANNSRVIPARLHGHKPTGGKVEIFLLRRLDDGGHEWACLVRGRNLNAGATVLLARGTGEAPIEATIQSIEEGGTRVIRFSLSLVEVLDELGQVPLPPYITEYSGDSERYQTVYSQSEGSAAAPTAGLHFTPELLQKLHQQGIKLETVTLHVGLDTFRPVTAEQIDDHEIHSEWAELTVERAQQINETTLQGGRVVAVGTTSTRTLEWAGTQAQGVDSYSDMPSELVEEGRCPWQRVAPFAGDVDLFIRPGYHFRAVDILLTNFHLPKSSLLMLVSAFIGQAYPEDIDAGRQLLLDVYEEAKREEYRFFSFGDAMLIL